MKYIDKLIEIGSKSISTFNSSNEINVNHKLPLKQIEELKYILNRRNGFLAFESALHFLSIDNYNDIPGITNWNNKESWSRFYEFDYNNFLFFAQDIFGVQFAISEKGILKFNPETGEFIDHSENINDWARIILGDYNYEVGWELSREWQNINFPIGAEYRLLPFIPFIIGGNYEISNLKAVKTKNIIEKYGGLYKQIKDIKDGEKITIKNWI